jgi:hypothetical protein
MFWTERQREIKRAALARVRAHPETSAMLFHDCLADRQADPGTGMMPLSRTANSHSFLCCAADRCTRGNWSPRNLMAWSQASEDLAGKAFLLGWKG